LEAKKMIINENILNEYLEYMKACGYVENTVYISTRPVLKKFIDYLNEKGIGFDSVNMNIITDFLDSFKKIGFKKNTIYCYVKRLRCFFKYLLNKKYIHINPFKNEVPENESLPDEFKEYYNKYITLKVNENTCRNSMKKIKRSIKTLLKYLDERGAKKFCEVKKEDLREFVKYLGDKKDEKGSMFYRPTSINRYLSDLKTYIMWLSKKGKLPVGFSNNLIFLRKAQEISRNILTRKELVSLFTIKANDLYDFMMKAIFIIQYATGLRIKELLNLEVKDIDFDKKELMIYEEKTKKERVVMVGEVGINYLKIFMEHVRPKVCCNSLDTGKIFLSYYEGMLLNENTVNRRLKGFLEKAKITKKISSHCFRHSYGTHLLENGLGIKEVSSLMGHRDLVSTERYTRLSPERLRKTINFCHPRERILSCQN
jgi:integrase/recombinase XerD